MVYFPVCLFEASLLYMPFKIYQGYQAQRITGFEDQGLWPEFLWGLLSPKKYWESCFCSVLDGYCSPSRLWYSKLCLLERRWQRPERSPVGPPCGCKSRSRLGRGGSVQGHLQLWQRSENILQREGNSQTPSFLCCLYFSWQKEPFYQNEYETGMMLHGIS